jgi:transposase-like protein
MSRPTFPKTVFEFQKQFSDEDECLKFLIQSRWPDGFICPRCGQKDYYWIPTRKLLQCKTCKYQASVTAGTIMHRSRVPLTAWFQAAYLATTYTPGISAVQFQRQVGLTNYETAFTLLHKLRSATISPYRTKLSGVVEVDETFIGGTRPGKRGRGAAGKSIVVGAVDTKDKYANRIRLCVIPNASSATLSSFVNTNVEKGSTIITDDWLGYSDLSKDGYDHFVDLKLPHVHRAFSNLKTWLMGTHHGSVRPQHLQAYLNKYVFRFNRRKTPMAAFQTVLGLSSKRFDPTYEELYSVVKDGAWKHPNSIVLSTGVIK